MTDLLVEQSTHCPWELAHFSRWFDEMGEPCNIYLSVQSNPSHVSVEVLGLARVLDSSLFIFRYFY